MATYKPLIVEICPREPRASMCTAAGAGLARSPHRQDVLDCCASGDVEPACAHVRDVIGVDFRIVARQPDGTYKNRKATAEEKIATCRAIYFDSTTDFDDEETAESYLIWEAASGVENEDA